MDTSACEDIVTRQADFYAKNECVVEGDATGLSLLPVTLGESTITDFSALQVYLNSPYAGHVRVALGQQVVTARLNARLFHIGGIPYKDIDGDGNLNTIDEIIDLGDSFYTYGTAGQKRVLYTLLSRINAEGAELPLYFDPACLAPPEICDGVDNNGNGDIDEDCGCIEVCDGVDNDGDGVVDDEGADEDGDGSSCDDCDDTDPAVHPDAPELPNGQDDDCDSLIDEGTTSYDDDGDGFSEAEGDCNDASAEVHPGALETCNGVDDNCSGVVDEMVRRVWYYDGDDDHYGATGRAVRACAHPAGFVARAGDCNDRVPSVNPAAAEVCDRVDNDCDGAFDEGC